MTRLAGDSDRYTFAMLDPDGNPTDNTFGLISVTTVLKKMTANGWGPGSYRGFKLGIRSQHPRVDEEKLEELYTKAKRTEWSPNRKLKEAGDRGTKAHWVAESVGMGYTVRTWHEGGDDEVAVHMVPEDPFMDGYCLAALTWYEDHPDVRIVGVEMPLWSLKHGFAGTADLLVFGEHKGQVEIIDWKTHAPNKDKRGPAYFDNLLQGAAYGIAYEEMFPEYWTTSRVVILKEDGDYVEDDREVDPCAFLDLLDAYRQLQEVL